MEWFSPVDWYALFSPKTPLLEIFLRGTIVYVALFCLLRFLRRQAGEFSMTDLLVLLLIADAAQNAMAGDYHSLPDGMALVSTLIFWNYLLDYLGYHFPAVERLIHPPPIALIKNGKILLKNLKKQLVTMDDLMSNLRENGVDDISKVKTVCLEGDGKISIVKKE